MLRAVTPDESGAQQLASLPSSPSKNSSVPDVLPDWLAQSLASLTLSVNKAAHTNVHNHPQRQEHE